MAIVEKIWFLVAVLPVLIISEGIQIFQNAIKEKNYFDAVLYLLIAVLVIAVIVLIFLGFR